MGPPAGPAITLPCGAPAAEGVPARDDALTPPYFAQDLHAAIRGSKLVALEEGGHYSYRRSHQEWNAAVDAFLAENAGSA